jgi:hypothetical protein
MVQQYNVNLQQGRNILRYDLAAQKRGTYQLVIETPGSKVLQRIVKQ